MKPCKIFVPCGAVGPGIDPVSFRCGVELHPDIISADAGSTDSGPFYLGTGNCKYARASVKADMRLILKAADELKEKYGMTAEVIDARTLVPFDYETVIASVKKTGRLVIVTDACERGSFASEVARQITEMAFDELDAPPVVVASKNWITPAHELEESFFPQPSWILDAIDAKIVPLKGHVRTTNQTLNQKLINERKGV